MSRVLDWCCKTGLSPLVHDRYTDDERKAGLTEKFERIFEEAGEGNDAVAIGDWKEALDAYLDMRFILEQIHNDLVHYGFGVNAAWEAVCDNNDLKTSVNRDWMVQQLALHTQRDGERKYYVDANEFDGELHYCLKRYSDNKVAKPVDFPKVDLSAYIPDAFKSKEQIEEVVLIEDKKSEFIWPTGDWKIDLRTKEDYDKLVDTGLQHEIYPDLPFSWEEVLKAKEGENND